MIPVKLQVQNFLSYGPTTQTIDFSSHRLICLSGKNGHGKSALLDAITWALWGQARKISGVVKADHGLLRLGQTKMMVALDFTCDNHSYRVKREYLLIHGKPYTTLEFGVSSEKNNTMIPLTDKTIRRTQAKIEKTIKLDYESFVNSAFLRQGNANEFSRKSPKDRKVILANILGLTTYETVRKRATEKAKAALLQQQRLSALHNKYDEELQTTTQITLDIKQVTDCLHSLKEQEKQLEAEQATFTAEQKQYAKQYEALTQSKQAYNTLQEQHENQLQELQKLVELWRKNHAKRLALASRDALESKRAQLLQRIQHQQTVRDNNLVLKEQLLHITEQLHTKKHAIQTQYEGQQHTQRLIIEKCKADTQTATNTIEQLQQETHELKAQIQTNIDALSDLTQNAIPHALDKEHAAILRVQFEKRKEKYHNFVAQGTATQATLRDLKQKADLARSSHGEPCCPLCEQSLSASRRTFLSKKFKQSELFLTHKITRLSKLVAHLKNYLVEKHTLLESYDAYVKQEHIQTLTRKQLEETVVTQQKKLHTIQDAITKATALHTKYATELITQEKKRAAIEQEAMQALEKDHTIVSLQRSIATLEKKAQQEACNPVLYKETQDALLELEVRIKHHTDSRSNKEAQQKRKMDIAQRCATLKKIRIEMKQLERICQSDTALTQTKEALDQRQKELHLKQTSLRAEREVTLQKMGSLERQKLFLQRVQQERETLIKTIEEFQAIQNDYQAIAHATGKDGIQALLIEEAIPEIEHEANEILAHLTDNGSHIILESLRDLKKGGTKETLDIKISDTNGIRPYELFSGGEAFRIDLALRIAISKLLTHRSGTTLQTLIIDEGFGSQDEEGLAHIMDALYRLQDNFLKVIIVSHLSSMKNQFPVHMVVEKRSSGSVVTVVEHG